MVIPKVIREYMDLHPGDRVDFVIKEDGEVVVRTLSIDVRRLRGRLKEPGRAPVSVSAMEAVVRKRAQRGLSE